ncbi:VanZ family protein [Anaerosacchariphilus polymeriproducens]|uniref:VanZ family protein n=1 Tax=Anaerosacchariphilus polymeriproducens TaxID=1812858 RepID=A0A371AUY8_9FIRM|nr:VanZ family protein [Anaerosacchariphilus polymeriproducens]RDU23385.1 VanZ family protein [Anaerosacchariphilus polymeriproducens]
MKVKHAKIIRRLGWIAFVIYLIFLIYFMFFAEGFGRVNSQNREYSYNIVPFREIKRFIRYSNLLGGKAVLINLVGNVVGFMPIGFIPPIITKRCRSICFMTLLGLECSLLIEISQLIFKVGSFDVDDLILNTLGAAAGYLVFAICNLLRRKYYG